MKKEISDEDLWYWYQQVEELKASGLPPMEYADISNIEHKKLTNMLYRFENCRVGHPERYKMLVEHGKKYIESKMTAVKYVESVDHKVTYNQIKQIALHLRTLEKVEELKRAQANPPKMKFIQLPALPMNNCVSPVPVEPEILKKQNDVELIITAGVRVMVSPEVGAEKLIRIIELLKDL